MCDGCGAGSGGKRAIGGGRRPRARAHREGRTEPVGGGCTALANMAAARVGVPWATSSTAVGGPVRCCRTCRIRSTRRSARRGRRPGGRGQCLCGPPEGGRKREGAGRCGGVRGWGVYECSCGLGCVWWWYGGRGGGVVTAQRQGVWQGGGGQTNRRTDPETYDAGSEAPLVIGVPWCLMGKWRECCGCGAGISQYEPVTGTSRHDDRATARSRQCVASMSGCWACCSVAVVCPLHRARSIYV